MLYLWSTCGALLLSALCPYCQGIFYPIMQVVGKNADREYTQEEPLQIFM